MAFEIALQHFTVFLIDIELDCTDHVYKSADGVVESSLLSHRLGLIYILPGYTIFRMVQLNKNVREIKNLQ